MVASIESAQKKGGGKTKIVVEQARKIETFFTKSKPSPPDGSSELDEAESELTSDPASSVQEEDAARNGPEKSLEEACANVSFFPSFMCKNDPAEWRVDDELRDHVARQGFPQNLDCDHKKSKRMYRDQARYFNRTFSERELPNGEVELRSSSSARAGFNDWKSTKVRIQAHEISMSHK